MIGIVDWELDTENILEDGLSPFSTGEFDGDDNSDAIPSPTCYTSPRRDYYRRPGDLYRLADVVPDIDFATGKFHIVSKHI